MRTFRTRAVTLSLATVLVACGGNDAGIGQFADGGEDGASDARATGDGGIVDGATTDGRATTDGGSNDAATGTDSGARDGGSDATITTDSGSDSGVTDSGATDSGVVDSGSGDAGSSDATVGTDSGSDAGTGATDAGTDAGSDAGTGATDAGADSGSGDAASCTTSDPCKIARVGDAGCEIVNAAEGLACDDENDCNGADACHSGVCTPGHGWALRDDFSGTTLDATKWTVNTAVPQGMASATVANGELRLSNRAHLVSAKRYDPAQGGVRVTTQWSFEDSGVDVFAILTRSDGVPGGEYGETDNGVECSLTSSGSLSIRLRNGGVDTGLDVATGALPLSTGSKVLLEMYDDGVEVTCSARLADSSQRLSVSGQFANTFTQNFVAFHNRENSEGQHSGLLDNVTIEGGVGRKPMAHWGFDNGTTLVPDLAGTRDATRGQDSSPGVSMSGFGASGTTNATMDSYFDFGTVLNDVGASNFAISFWANVPTLAEFRDLIGNRDSASGGQYLGVRMSTNGNLGAEMYGFNAPGGALDSAFSIADAWHHVVLTREGTTLTWYVDGIHRAHTTVDGVPDIGSQANMYFGRSPFTGAFENRVAGAIDDVRIYDTSLDMCQVQNVYGSNP